MFITLLLLNTCIADKLMTVTSVPLKLTHFTSDTLLQYKRFSSIIGPVELIANVNTRWILSISEGSICKQSEKLGGILSQSKCEPFKAFKESVRFMMADKSSNELILVTEDYLKLIVFKPVLDDLDQVIDQANFKVIDLAITEYNFMFSLNDGLLLGITNNYSIEMISYKGWSTGNIGAIVPFQKFM